MIVDNRPGAGGTIGDAMVARASPDGVTLAALSEGHVVNPVVNKDIPCGALKDFATAAPAGSKSNVLMVAPELGVRTRGRWWRRRKPGQVI